MQQVNFARVENYPLIRRVNTVTLRSDFRSPSTVWIPPADRKIHCSPLVAQLTSPALPLPASPREPPAPVSSPPPPPPPPPDPDPCARETVVKALQELMANKKRAKEGGTPPSPTIQENKRIRRGSTENGQPASEPLVANEVPAPLEPQPDMPKQGPQLSPSSEEATSKKACPASTSSADGEPKRPFRNNCIYSSYSSSGGIEQLWKKRGIRTSSVSSQDSSSSGTPEKPLRKGKPPDSSLVEKVATHKSKISSPAKADKAIQVNLMPNAPVQNQDTPPVSVPAPVSGSSSSTTTTSGGARRRKVQLVITPNEPLIMPPPIELGYKITRADYDADRLERLRQFKRGLDSSKDSPPPAEDGAPAPSDGSAAMGGSTSGQEGRRDAPERQDFSGQIGTPAAFETSQGPVVPPLTSSLPGNAPVPISSWMTDTAAQTLPSSALAAPMATAPMAGPFPFASAPPAGSESSLAMPSFSQLIQTPTGPSATPKPSILFGMLTSPLGSPPTMAVTATLASPAPGTSSGLSTTLFLPVFGTLTHTDSSGFSGSGVLAFTPGATLPTGAPPSAAPSYAFKPIFGALPPQASTTSPAVAGTSSLFAFQTSLQPTAAAGLPAGGLPGFSAHSAGFASTSASLSGAVSVTTISASKPVFSLGPSLLAGAPATTVAAAPSSLGGPSASQPSPFGVSSGSASAAASPLYPFGTLAGAPNAGPSPLASPAFGQAPPGAAEGAPGAVVTTSFSTGSSLLAPAAPLPMTTQSPFGSGPPSGSPATSAGGFVSATKLALPSAANGGVPGSQAPALKAAPGLVGFASPSTFTGSEVQPAFAGGSDGGGSITPSQAPFGGTGALTSFGAKSTPQPSFGALTPFGAATTTTTAPSGFSSGAQVSAGGGSNSSTTTTTTTGGFNFGGPMPSSSSSSPFGVSNQPPTAAGGTAFGGDTGASSSSPNPGMLSVNFHFGGGATGAATPFGASVGQNTLGPPAQSPEGFGLPPSAPETKPAFGGAPAPDFGRSQPSGGGQTPGNTPTFDTAGASNFRTASTPNFRTDSTSNFRTDSAPNFRTDGASNFRTDGAPNFRTDSTPSFTASGPTFAGPAPDFGRSHSAVGGPTPANTPTFDTAGASNFRTASTPNFRTDSTSNFRTDSAPNFRTDGASNFRTDGAPNFRTDSTPNFRTDSTPSFTASGPTFAGPGPDFGRSHASGGGANAGQYSDLRHCRRLRISDSQRPQLHRLGTHVWPNVGALLLHRFRLPDRGSPTAAGPEAACQEEIVPTARPGAGSGAAPD
nr:nuclear envelope pore membrane protein POM 121C [Pogona vitticeps]